MAEIADVIIPVHGRADLLAACLDSLARGDVAAIDTVVVVDDASPSTQTRALRAVAAGRPMRIEWLSMGHRSGFVGAANAGWLASPRDIAIVLNNDVAVGQQTVAALCETLEREPEVAAIGPTSDNRRDLFQYRDETATPGADTQTSYLTAMCLAIRRSAVGHAPFDPIYAPGYFEDLDLSCRLRTSGWRLAISERAPVRHLGAATFSALPATASRRAGNYATFAARWGWLPTHPALEQVLRLADSAETV